MKWQPTQQMNSDSELKLYKKLLGIALNFTSTQAKTEFEVTSKLGRAIYKIHSRYPASLESINVPEVIGKVVQFLIDSKILDDAAYAKIYVAQQEFAKNPKSRLAVANFLMKKGMSRELIAESLSATSDAQELKSLEHFAIKKLRTLKSRGYDARVLKQKLTSYLVSKGFGLSAICAVIDAKLT